MDEKLLRSLLRQKDEMDWFDFKRKWKLYDSNDALNTEERDELIKDILGFANGNSGIVRKTKYLVIGADDKQFDENGSRVTYSVDYRVPSQSDITKWVNAACNPSVVGIECDFATIDDKKLYVITIPPTFDLHETIRELNAKKKFSKFAVFMRQDEHTVLASVRDGIIIQQLKAVFRQEIANPPAILFGAIIGATIAVMFYGAGYSATGMLEGTLRVLAKSLVAIIGAGLGAEAGWIFREWNTLRYDWRYWSRQKKAKVVIAITITFVIIAFGLRLIF
ncbi:MAG: helix-turn-helix domain-containing protein [Chloroflexota bacterium]